MFRVWLLMVLAAGSAMAQQKQEQGPQMSLTLTAGKHNYRLGQPIRVRYQIENIGETPFFIPKGIENVSDARGCVILDVGTQHSGTGVMEKHYVDYSSDYWEKRDINQEIHANWVLLKPGQFYGMSTILNFRPLKAGRYWIVATHVSGNVSEKERLQLTDQNYPLVFGTHISKPVEIVVTAEGKAR